MNPKIDAYFDEGCGRCPLGGTPDCKVHSWEKELVQLRKLILNCGLTEELKWSVPCYTFQKINILIMSAFKEYCAISFFKGVLLKDTDGILHKPGENSQSVRLIKFTSVKEILNQTATIKAYIYEAIEVERSGLKVKFNKPSEFTIPEEFQIKLDELPELKSAFEALTPGRQRGYILHFSAAKQSNTRISRIEKNIPRILKGIGFNDR